MDVIINNFVRECNNTTSDINEHLPTLYKYAKESESVFETGVRGCVSSWAILFGLLSNNKSKKRMLMNDIDACNITKLLDAVNLLPPGQIDVGYIWKNNLQLELNETFDMTFIDTWHVYGQLKRELAKFAPLTNKYILLHDTTVDKIYGETIRVGLNATQQSIQSGFPVEEILCGLGKAVDEFLAANPKWILLTEFTNNNGLTVLERVENENENEN
jgi:hypothetical protein